MTLFYCTTDQVRVLSLCVNIWRSYASLWTLNIGNVQFSALFSHMLSHIELKFCIWLCFNVIQMSLSVVTLHQFLKELSLFWNLEYRKYTVFLSFLQHAVTYWAEILQMSLFWCTSEQVRVLSLCVNFWRSYASLWT